MRGTTDAPDEGGEVTLATPVMSCLSSAEVNRTATMFAVGGVVIMKRY